MALGSLGVICYQVCLGNQGRSLAAVFSKLLGSTVDALNRPKHIYCTG